MLNYQPYGNDNFKKRKRFNKQRTQTCRYRTLLIHFFSFTAREGHSQDVSKTFARAIVNVAAYLRLLGRPVRHVQEKLLRPLKFVQRTVDQTTVWFRLVHFRIVLIC